MSAAVEALEDAKAERLTDIKEYDQKLEYQNKLVDDIRKARAELLASITDIEAALSALKQSGWKTDKPVKVL